MTSLSDMAKELRDLKDQKSDLEDSLKAVNKSIRDLAEKRIPEEMENKDIDKYTVDGIGTVYTQVEVYSNVLKEDRERWHEWLRESGNEDMITNQVNPQTQKAFIKERLANGLDYPEFVNVTMIETARLRRS